ncbi:major facilitator superfamily domain-containing protein [Rhypophila decipiens]|uniref:Major facilitator superfamily domain-containing protein n=1 Tax=Rhypophila decipiens TaxID=261697 RepID=A0AAN6YCH1_9PEZI|nr:major facilitator superfamily domain-containing protein [Rhypophila decipiens]
MGSSSTDIERPPSQPKAANDKEDVGSIKQAVGVGRENLSSAIPPDDTYEGKHRWDPEATWTPAEEAQVVRKTDFLLLSWLCVMFFGLQLDRGNLANANADNFLDDMNLSTDDYNNGNTIQLLAFLAAEFPVQLLTKRYGFRRVLPAMMFAWGTVSWAQSWMHDRAGFYVTRALIGACEGGFIPGAILYATYFYTSKELSIRLGIFWSTLNVARIISALLAAGILEMRGVDGKPGWFWLFLLEGLLTVVLAVISLLYLPASPTDTRNVLFRKPWYTERQEVIMTNRILRDDPAKGLTALKQPATWQDIKSAWGDKSLWGLYFIGLVAYVPATPVSGYLTLIFRSLGFSTLATNMLSIPSAFLQICLMLGLAYSSEYFNERTWHCFFGEFWAGPLLVALITLPDGGREWTRYTLVTLISGYPYFHPIVTSWISENSFDVKKRAIAAATYNVIVQMGSLIGGQIYRKYDGPYYKQGNKVLVSFCALALVVFVVQRQVLVYLNRKKEEQWDRMTEEEKFAYQNDIAAREADGNKRLDFRASTPQAKATKQRKIGSRSCDGCKIRKVKCTEQPPCERCRAVGIECTFNKTPAVRGPRSLRAKTLEQIRKAQQDGPLPASSSPADKQPPAQPASAPSNDSRPQPEISVESLVLRLCIYRVRLFPVWPIVAVEEVIAALHRDAHDVDTFALAVAVGAATMAQLKLERFQDGGVDDGITAQLLESECQRIRRAHGLDSGAATLNKLRTSFFLHIYHENQEPGGTQSLLYMREAITLAQIMGLHRAASYLGLDAAEDRLRRRIIWLLFVTERGVSMLHGLPLVLTSTDRLPPLAVSSSDDEAHVLPAFKKLVNLFWIFDQSRAFEILQDTADQASNGTASFFNQELLNTLFRRLQDAPLEMENGSSDVQKADICVTRQWMQVLIWRATLGGSRHGDSSQASAAVTAPIHIAQEFLDFISQLPNAALEAHGPAIEFKVYEIASAVADAVTGPLILVKLQRILATTRGGNSSLLNQLAARIAHLKAPAFPAPDTQSLGLLGQHGVYNLPADNGHVMRHAQHGGQGQPSGDVDVLNGQNWLLGVGSPRIP